MFNHRNHGTVTYEWDCFSDISSVEAFKRALLDARSIAYLKVGSDSKSPAAAKELLKFLLGPVAVPVIKAQGMELVPK